MKKPVRCLNDNLPYSSIKAAAEHYRVSASNISSQITGRIKHVSGLRFEFIKEEENNDN